MVSCYVDDGHLECNWSYDDWNCCSEMMYLVVCCSFMNGNVVLVLLITNITNREFSSYGAALLERTLGLQLEVERVEMEKKPLNPTIQHVTAPFLNHFHIFVPPRLFHHLLNQRKPADSEAQETVLSWWDKVLSSLFRILHEVQTTCLLFISLIAVFCSEPRKRWDTQHFFVKRGNYKAILFHSIFVRVPALIYGCTKTLH